MIPENRLRELIGTGSVSNFEIDVVRKNRVRGSSHYSNFSFVKTPNGQIFASEIINLKDFLSFV